MQCMCDLVADVADSPVTCAYMSRLKECYICWNVPRAEKSMKWQEVLCV